MLISTIRSLVRPYIPAKLTDAMQIGQVGEIAAQRYLKKIGYRILKTNWRHRNYEIDIVALNAEILVFVEVRTRNLDALVSGYDSITKKKRESLKTVFNAYLAKVGHVKHYRFDVIEVTSNGTDNTQELRHFENIPLW
ncbi:MAG: YraN family protein [Puniceicoccales bacterium]|jgi:putative endonuclease|nr:YraN family protein [Puniceicoccales bacterium]